MPSPLDLRESFPALEDAATGAGVSATKSLEGDALAGKVGQTTFAFQDANGNLVHPQLDAQGRLLVQLDGQGTRSRAHGVVAGALISATGSSYGNLQTVLTLPLVANKTIGDIAGKVVCRRSAYFRLQYSDAGGSAVVLDSSIVDAGQYNAPLGLGPNEDTFSVPASASAPVLSVLAANFDKASDLHATISVLQF